MRVAVAGLHAETNTFAPGRVDRRALDAITLRGEAIVSRLSDSRETMAGLLNACNRTGVEVVPLVHASAQASGMIEAEAFEAVRDEILDGLGTHGPFDAVLLAQHGAAVADGHLDVDGELVAGVRGVIGPDGAVGVVLDLHGNVSPRLTEAATIVVGYRENPHRDPLLRAEECAELTLATARGQRRPIQRLVSLPMVVPVLGGWTGGGAMADVMAEAKAIAERHSLLSHSVFHGFGYADVPHLGSSVLAAGEGNAENAELAAREIAAVLWRRREELRGSAVSPAEALAEVAANDGGRPTILLDVGDNIGGGSPGDSTVLLAEAIEQGVSGIAVAICDEGAARAGVEAGDGARLELSVGATTPASAGPHLTLHGRVGRVTDGRFDDRGETHGGFSSFDGGPTILFTTDGGQEVIISSRVVPPFSLEQLRAVGLDPEGMRAIVAKGVIAPRASYEAIADRFLPVDSPGVTAADLSVLAFERRPEPLWPLDEEAQWID